jgi:hypothetical protein
VAHRGRQNADHLLAAELAAGKTVRDAAAAAGLAERTAHRRLTEPAFRAQVAELRGRMTDAAAGRLADGMAEAAAVLRNLLADPDPNVRHKSAVKLIELGLKTRDVTELADRLARVEALFAGEAPDARPDPAAAHADRGAGADPAGSPGPAAGRVPPGPGPADD